MTKRYTIDPAEIEAIADEAFALILKRLRRAEELVGENLLKETQPGNSCSGTYCQKTIGVSEVMSLDALLMYVSDERYIPMDGLQSMLETKMGVPHYTKIKNSDYQSAVQFMVDVLDGSMN